MPHGMNNLIRLSSKNVLDSLRSKYAGKDRPMAATGTTPVDADPPPEEPTPTPEPKWLTLWERLRHWGLGDSTLRIATTISTALMILLVVWVMGTFTDRDAQLGMTPAILPWQKP
jgi:hypothetical protein